MERQVDESIRSYSALDAVAAEILSDKRQMVDLDGKRNKGREALRQLRSKNLLEGASNSWTCFGNTFIKMDTNQCVQMLEKDQKTLTSEIEKLREGLKPKVRELQRMEGHVESQGFELKGMNIEELIADN